MSFRFVITTLAAIAGGLSAGPLLAAETMDAHQRAREWIAPSFTARPPAPAGVMGRVIEPGGYVDPHALARKGLRDDSWRLAPERDVPSLARSWHADAHAVIRARLAGRGD